MVSRRWNVHRLTSLLSRMPGHPGLSADAPVFQQTVPGAVRAVFEFVKTLADAHGGAFLRPA